jgi:hypothetical protein
MGTRWTPAGAVMPSSEVDQSRYHVAPERARAVLTPVNAQASTPFLAAVFDTAGVDAADVRMG